MIFSSSSVGAELRRLRLKSLKNKNKKRASSGSPTSPGAMVPSTRHLTVTTLTKNRKNRGQRIWERANLQATSVQDDGGAEGIFTASRCLHTQVPGARRNAEMSGHSIIPNLIGGSKNMATLVMHVNAPPAVRRLHPPAPGALKKKQVLWCTDLYREPVPKVRKVIKKNSCVEKSTTKSHRKENVPKNKKSSATPTQGRHPHASVLL